jgi:hypothetical protein
MERDDCRVVDKNRKYQLEAEMATHHHAVPCRSGHHAFRHDDHWTRHQLVRHAADAVGHGSHAVLGGHAGAYGTFLAHGLGIVNNFWAYLSCMAFAGIFMPIFNAPSMAILQARVNSDFMGRVFSVTMMAGSLAMPFGMAVFGPAADAMEIDWCS